MFKKTGLLVMALLLVGVLLVACQPETVEVQVPVEVTRVVTETVVQEGEQVEVTRIVTEEVEVVATPVAEEPMMEEQPVTLRYNHLSEPPSLDPSLATDTTSIGIISDMFMALTSPDPVTGEVGPYLATDWEVSDDGLVYTFNLRQDIPWVNYNPGTGEWSEVLDDEGNVRIVNAHDVVYGVKRTLDPATASDYAYVLYNIANAQEVNQGDEGVTLDDVGVEAPDDWTVQFTLENPASYFPSIASMWVTYPQPQWLIESSLGDRWTEAGVIQTNGPYGLEEWIHSGSLNMLKNPLWPEADSVQIERIEGVMINEISTGFAMFENNELDTSGVPLTEIDRVKADPQMSEELVNAPTPCTYYYGFTNNKPPFDDVRVRRAFSQAIDRQSLIDNVLKGGQIPATTFAPPGIFGAPEPGTLGLGTDAAAAQASLQEYLDENGMTIDDLNDMGITLMFNTSESHANIAQAIQQMWKDTLGVDVSVENQEWKVYLQTVDNSTPLTEMPHIWRLGWCADYADENNWVHEVFNADAGDNNLRRGCVDDVCTQIELSEFDELTIQAAAEQDQATRAELYAQAEDILAREEAAYAPIYHYTTVETVKPWLTRFFPPVGGNNFRDWTIDQAAQLEALGGQY